MLLATKSYGRKTNRMYSTYQEMNYSLDHNPFLIKMPWNVHWEETAAELCAARDRTQDHRIACGRGGRVTHARSSVEQ